MRRLIVNADDFGLTRGVNRAIAELHRQRVLTSATLMANASATDDAIEIALAVPSMGVGCHVVLVDGEPVLSAGRDIPHLADASTGRFRPSLSSFLLWLHGPRSRFASSAVHAAEIEAEAATQIASLQNRGLRLTHIDTHKHVHMFPSVLRPILRAARAAGISVVRNPFEPAWSLHATSRAPWLRRKQVAFLGSLEPTFRRIVAEEGFTTTDGAIGVLATGTLDPATVQSLVRQLPPGTWELVAHPGYNDADLAQTSTRLMESRETERKALLALRQFPEIELTSFAASVSSNKHLQPS
ncbi:MAG: ChbG/HpnK family deacetylase [Terracidiphilus sp.]